MDSYRKARSGQEVEISVPLYGKKWQVRWSPVYDQSGKTVSGVAGVAIDDTERQSLLEDVDSRRELLQGVLDNMAEAVFAVGADGKFRLANKAARFLLNLDEGNPINLSIKDVSETLNVRDLEGRPIRSSDLVLARALRGESVPESLTMMRPIGGDRDIITLANAAPFRDLEGKGRGAVIVLRDVTDLVNFDRMKDQFIRVAAHELKTPVTVVKLNAQTLPRLMPQLEPRQKQILSFIVQGADRIDRIVRDLIDLSQLQIKSVWLSKVKVDLCALAQESYVRRKRLSDAREISLSLPASPIWIMADKNRVEQALDILLDNAVKYSPDGGRIDMSLEAHGDFVKATVKDSGVGIPKDKQAKIFERFYRAHTDTPYDYGGLGVGLYICREIVKGHEGSIGFESRESAGSSFYFSLPLAKEGSA
jgi:signal transduction histidine kinase